jgi:3-dehydroquinate synthase
LKHEVHEGHKEKHKGDRFIKNKKRICFSFVLFVSFVVKALIFATRGHMTKIFLYGPSGSGKSTVGKILAQQMGLSFVDLDALIEEQAGMPIPQIMGEQGEPAFRDKESSALQQVVESETSLVALGGGALLREGNRAMAEAAGMVVFLQASVDTLVARLSADYNRPLLAGGDIRERLTGLLERRKEHYASFPTRFDSNALTPAQIAWQIQIALGHFHIGGMGPAYDAIVEPGGLDRLGALLRERDFGGPVAIVTESNVGPLYAERAAKSLREAGYETTIITFPAGEANKTLESIQQIWSGLLQGGLDRRSTVVALGGGVTGDMAGFAAATFMRGVRWVGVPTSLLAMVDASLGGKTGIDLPQGKNLIGAFHPPSLVLADPDTLASLPEAELRSGLAEVVKHGIIGDPGLFALCAAGYESVKSDPSTGSHRPDVPSGGQVLAGIVRRAMAVKVAVIEADPYERGLRASLNLGHTVGHAVELVSAFKLRHGEAIAIGIVVEARLAERLKLAEAGLSEEIAAALDGLGLPTRIPPEFSREAIIQAMRVDKKKAAGVVKFALPVKIGEVKVGVAVDNLELIFE